MLVLAASRIDPLEAAPGGVGAAGRSRPSCRLGCPRPQKHASLATDAGSSSERCTPPKNVSFGAQSSCPSRRPRAGGGGWRHHDRAGAARLLAPLSKRPSSGISGPLRQRTEVGATSPSRVRLPPNAAVPGQERPQGQTNWGSLRQPPPSATPRRSGPARARRRPCGRRSAAGCRPTGRRRRRGRRPGRSRPRRSWRRR